MNYPDAMLRPGPLEKQGYPGQAVNQVRGVVCHSMVGYLGGAMGELDKLDRRASWHYSVLQDGRVLAHYPDLAVTWHCGSPQWNGRLIGIEHEGGFQPEDEPLTDLQREASVKLVRWLSFEHGFPLVRGVGLYEHNEVAPPSDATSCPSHRIPWDAYTEEEVIDAPTKAEFGSLFSLCYANTKALAAFGGAFFDLAKHVYGDSDPRIDKLQAEVDALEAAAQSATKALEGK